MKNHRVLWKCNIKGTNMTWKVKKDLFVENLS